MTPRELANEHSKKHNARTTGGDSDAPKKIRELQQRIIQLEEELMDTKNKYAALVADVVLYEDRGERIKRLEEAGDALAKTQTYDLVETVNWRKAKEDKP